METKNILINLRLLQKPYTGTQSYIYNLVKNVLKNNGGFEFTLLTVNDDGANKFVRDLSNYPRTALIDHRSAPGLVSETLFDLVFVNRYIADHDLYFSPVNTLPLRTSPGKKYVTGVLDLCTFKVPDTSSLGLRFFYSLSLNASLRRADRILAISGHTKRDLLDTFKLDEEKIDVVHLGIDDDFFQCRSEKTDVTRLGDRIGLDLDRRYCLTMGSSRRKNVPAVIDAFFKGDGGSAGDHLVVIVSDPRLVDEFSSHIEKNRYDRQRVILTKRHLSNTELKTLYVKAFMLIYCPVYEGFGLPVLEAMACDCPVVASNVASIPEVVNEAGLLADPRDSSDIAEKINLIRRTPALRDRLVHDGRSNIKRFSWERAGKQALKIFESALETA